MPIPPPPSGTVERWAWDYIRSIELAHKLHPPAPPELWEPDAPSRRLERPGRPPELRLLSKSAKTPRPGALVAPAARAALMHTFLHHELQAAELMAWALLAFPQTPLEFRRGLLKIFGEEVVHMGLYNARLEDLGCRFGEQPVRDWFWQRVPSCRQPLEFVAVLGLGLEGGNLDYAELFAQRFRAAGDELGARAQERVAAEEVGHVRFALRWFERWTGGQDFDRWCAALPSPLSPLVLRGLPLNRRARARAGLEAEFLDRLEAWRPAESGA